MIEAMGVALTGVIDLECQSLVKFLEASINVDSNSTENTYLVQV